MPGRAVPRAALLLWALFLMAALTIGTARPARAEPVGTADGPADVALAIGATGAAATATGLWLRWRHRRGQSSDGGGDGAGGGEGGDG
ncbi:hypothetical protein [Streptomyces bambusae]|uniref:Uncharacterized protein n=1 Tax=Streptomyces bambusae TaxID=1550616 RepID=A0ABS6Z5T9_9ACTN|nr:hypothetical protein [Streptomyces bambusae]MBW5483097.1 hypothetical protein [Streptomyces bambusae]